MKKLLFFFLLVISQSVQAQVKIGRTVAKVATQDYTVRLGYGQARSEHLSFFFNRFEGSAYRNLGKRSGVSLTVGMGQGTTRDTPQVWDMRGNIATRFVELNGFYSPFGHAKRNDFRIGGGVSLVQNRLAFIGLTRVVKNQITEQNQETRNIRDWTVNFVLENNFALSEHWIVGAKAILYVKGDTRLIQRQVITSETSGVLTSSSNYGGYVTPAFSMNLGYRF